MPTQSDTSNENSSYGQGRLRRMAINAKSAKLESATADRGLKHAYNKKSRHKAGPVELQGFEP